MSRFDVYRALFSPAHFKTLGVTPMADKQPYDRRHMTQALDTILMAWTKNPYLRLGQLLTNAVHLHDFFYIEDDKLMVKVAEFGDTTQTMTVHPRVAESADALDSESSG